ncbi:hypothetical protein F6X53_31210 [Methylobacterium soli]|uniref:Uncharacterized protein n=1 Tax=Methylobacterium soli TaxID=553447 RepID=A0A6L3SP41_9HYPH|nr:hypothetical protein F6X53_31210 [Methylobacterium soli]
MPRSTTVRSLPNSEGFYDMSEALTSKDGKFTCTPEHAVEVAYMISTAEGLLAFETGVDDRAVLETLESYLTGDASPDEVMRDLSEIKDEARATREDVGALSD